jgi:hypothetical protein
MKYMVLAALGCILSGCSTSQMTYRDLDLPSEINHDYQKELTEKEERYDLAQLKYALTHAYSGRRYLPGEQFPNLLRGLDEIHGEMTALDFCKEIQKRLHQVSDSHLHSQLYKDRCRVTEAPRGSVGSNFYSGRSVWDAELRSKQGVTALYISIRTFPSHQSPEWNGFIEAVTRLLPRARLVILDMRGNDGGDDTMGGELSHLLAGNNLKSPYSTQWESQTPENEQLFVNTMQLYIRMGEKENKETAYLKKMKGEYEAKLAQAVQGKIPSEAIHTESDGETFDLRKSIQKPIYILADRECVSSCESTINFFEFNPLAKRVGENTGGYNHFGNNGYLVLKNSGIAVMMASTFNKYADGRFIERIGILPQIQVPIGKDALDYAWSDYFSERSLK